MTIPALKGILKKLQARGDSKTTIYNLETAWDQAKKDAAAKFKMNPPKPGEKVPSQYWGMVMFLVKQKYSLNESLEDLYRDDYPYEDIPYEDSGRDEPLEASEPFDSEIETNLDDSGDTETSNPVQHLVGVLFWAKNRAHALHLSANSFAVHMALNELYVELTNLVDELVETYQGKYGLLEIHQWPLADTGPIDFMRLLCREVESHEIQDSFLVTIVDEILVLLYRTKYKLENLK